MRENQLGSVCGRPAKIVKVFAKCIRVLYLKPTELLTSRNNVAFVPFESNVPKSYWTSN